MVKEAFLIYNPQAGKHGLRNDLSDVVEIFSKYNYNLYVYATQRPKDAYEKVKEVGDRFPLIVCSGGDGTLNEVINAYHELDSKPDLAYLPTGTTNDFARSIQLEMNHKKLTKKILENPELLICDIGKFNNACFVYVAAFGSISEVSYTTSQSSKKLLGHTAYLIEAVKQFVKLKKHHMKITYDEGVIEDDFCLGMITNSLSVGGFSFFDKNIVSLQDGYLECILIKKPNNPLDMQQIVSALTSKKYDTCDFIKVFQSKKIEITSNKKIKWTLDGEYGGKHSSCYIENIQKEVNFIK